MDKKYYVYDHISPSGKHYIGITCQRLSTRWGKGGKMYLRKLKNGKYRRPAFAAAIEKYGWDAFEHIVLFHNCSEELAKKLEVAYIAYWTERGLAYNCTDGGDTGMRPKKTAEEKKAVARAYKATEKCKAKERLYRKEHREEINAKRRERLATDEEFRARRRATNQKWRQEHKEELKAASKLYNQAHKEECRERTRKYYQEHKEECREKQHQYYQEHKDEMAAQQAAYREAHKEELKAKGKEYYAAHREERKAAASRCYYKRKEKSLNK